MAPTLTDRRAITLDTGRRTIEAPVDSLGRMRFRATLDRRAIERAEGDSASAGFRGHAAVFNKRSWIGSKRWGFWESIEKGAFSKTIGEADVRFLKNHDPNLLIARNTAGTLRLAEDAVGLDTDADMDTRQSYVSDLVISLERGDISQMSFAFEPIAWRFEEAEDGNEHFILTELRLWDVSVVTYPAYEETDAGLRGVAFDVLCRSLGIDDKDRSELLRQISEGEDITLPGPAETTRGNPNGPAETTRDDSPPAETTGTPDFRSLSLATLARATSLKEL